ncbi:MAG: hypothetical protein WD871_10025 [Xanthobacteraceae bacterium]
MAKRKYSSRLYLDMPFAEAVARFVGTDPRETDDNIQRSKQKKPPGGKKRKRKPSGASVQADNVVSLRDRRMRKRNHGR